MKSNNDTKRNSNSVNEIRNKSNDETKSDTAHVGPLNSCLDNQARKSFCLKPNKMERRKICRRNQSQKLPFRSSQPPKLKQHLERKREKMDKENIDVKITNDKNPK
jgi:hypothetical protein